MIINRLLLIEVLFFMFSHNKEIKEGVKDIRNDRRKPKAGAVHLPSHRFVYFNPEDLRRRRSRRGASKSLWRHGGSLRSRMRHSNIIQHIVNTSLFFPIRPNRENTYFYLSPGTLCSNRFGKSSNTREQEYIIYPKSVEKFESPALFLNLK